MNNLIDAQQREEMITSTMPLVGHIVREMWVRLPRQVSRDDLTSAGLVALVRAAHSFDPERGVPFARYATPRIRGALVDELRAVDWASRSVRRRARDLDATRNSMAAALGRVPSNSEVAAAMGIDVDEVDANDEDLARAQVLSLQGSAEESFEDLLPADSPTPEQIVEHRERLTYMIESVAELPERLKAVVVGYFLEERPMAEIAAELDVSESRVSQMRAEALGLMREAMNRELDPDLVSSTHRPGGCVERRRGAYFAAVAARHAASVRPAVVAQGGAPSIERAGASEHAGASGAQRVDASA
ncbi:sigma-70 family RNA polymerase sigma factor [Nocardioides yefusunii]|uniref:Sigma-70 family RNA polymerase sigma factor n=1 Tax=Nocardioides yefusunii TaxID=2500546 RepID=A0ABW1QZN5_9ACTN|nr:sigma-70 family RNA polymerase sigma factor [Nocardioides yefusunii]